MKQTRMLNTRSETFFRNYGLFGVIIVSIFIAQNILFYWQIVVNLFSFASLYYLGEMKLLEMLYTITKIDYPHSAKQKSILALLSFSLCLSMIGVRALYSLNIPDRSIVPTYCYSLYTSMVIFSFATTLKALSIFAGVVSTKQARKGIFGILLRVVLIIRHIIVIPIWLQHFKECKSNISYAGYVIVKCIIQIWLLWDLKKSIKCYSIYNNDIFMPIQNDDTKDDCVICQDEMKDPIKLKCGHSFCQACIVRWLHENKICPTCRTEIACSKTIEYSDGFIPSTAIIFSF